MTSAASGIASTAPACSTAVPTCSSSGWTAASPPDHRRRLGRRRAGLVADGTSIAFASNRAADRDWEDRTDIYLVPPAGGRAKKLTKAATRSGRRPGRRRHDDRLPRPDRRRAGANVRIWTVPSGGGDPACVTADLDVSVGSDVLTDMRAGHLALAPVWTGDGARLRVLISARGSVHLVEGDVAGLAAHPGRRRARAAGLRRRRRPGSSSRPACRPIPATSSPWTAWRSAA